MLNRLLSRSLQANKNSKGFLFVFLLGLTFHGYSQHYDLRKYSDELAHSYVYSIIQDNNGYLWIGTDNGLSRFDGISFRSFTTRDSLADNFITCSFKNGNDLWFGHMNGMLTHCNGEKFTPIITLNGKTSITDIEKSPRGDIWVATYSYGLMKIQGIACRTLNSNIINQIAIYSFKFITEKEILVGSTDGLNRCSVDESGKVDVIQHFNEIPESKITDIVKMRNDSGYYVASQSNGIFQVIQKGDNFKIKQIALDIEVDLTGVQSISEDCKSNLWVSTFGNGLIKLIRSSSGQFKEVDYFNESTGCSTNNVKTSYEDREGNIWSGNYGTGLTQITRKALSFYPIEDVLYGSSIYSIYTHKNDRWLGTDKGLLKIDQSTGQTEAFYSSQNGLPQDKITAIYSDQGKELWIGTGNNGVYRMMVDNEKILSYKIGNGVLENSVTAISGRDNQIWIGTKKGVCNINTNTNKIQWYTLEKSGLPHNFVNHLFIDSKNRLWVSTRSNILTYIENGKVEKITIPSEKGVLTLGSISEDSDSNIWVGSIGGGIFRIKADSIKSITSNEGLVSNYCYSLLADNNNNIWVGHRGGLSKIRTATRFVKPLQQYEGINPSCEFSENAIFKDQNDGIWFGSNEGLWFYDPTFEDQVLLPPVLNITSFRVDDEEVDLNKKIVLPPGNHKIRVEFLGINLKEPLNVRYQYQLIGYDQFPENTKSTSVIYPHLSDGKYNFILTSSTGDGVKTKYPLSINFVIKTPVWKQWWFYIFSFIVLSILINLYIKWREYKYFKEKHILESKVKDRTSELAKINYLLKEKQELISEQNIELAQHRDYLEQLVDERTKELLKAKNKAEESDKLKTAFLQNMSHEIRTPMNGILGLMGILNDPDLDVASKNNYIDLIKQSGERLMTTINDIIEISKLESEQVTTHYSHVNITELLHFNLNFFKQETEKKGVLLKLSENIQDNNTIVETDGNKVNSILINLIKNAIKFTNKGTIEFGYSIEGDSIIFYVKDSGIGIPADRLEAIFERFVQADLNNTRPHEGSGLGLSIVKEYLKILNGKIWVESKIDVGSTFFFSLPYKPVNKKQSKQGEKIATNNTHGKIHTILIAEDDEGSFLFLENILEKLPVNLLHTDNGRDAVKLFKENPDISLILMDIKMPELNGYDTTRMIRQFNKTIPIIAQTAYAMPNDKEKAIEVGFTDYITKPINRHKLILMVQKYLDKA